jgi:hypothetical protein
VSAFCGDGVCAARIQVWLLLPHDEEISDPCPHCLHTLAHMFGLPPTPAPRSLVDVRVEVLGSVAAGTL